MIGDPDGKGGYTLRLYYNPLVPLIWLGAAAMAFLAGWCRSPTAATGSARPRVRAARAFLAGGGAAGGIGQCWQKPLWTLKRPIYLLPVAVFGLMALGFYRGLGIDENVLPSPLIDEAAPQFDLPPLPGHAKGLSETADLQGHVGLGQRLRVVRCGPCRMEHPVLQRARQDSEQVPDLRHRL